MSKVSALVSAYFAEDYLEGRLENLLEEKVDLQILVVAQKGTGEATIARRFGAEVIETPDVPTIGKAWNLAIKQATGDYLTTANSDDRFHYGGLRLMVEHLDDNPEVGLVFSRVDIDDGKNKYPWYRFDHKTGLVRNMRVILERRCIIGPMPLWRKSIHKDIGYFDGERFTVASDYEMWLRMVRSGVKFFYIDDSCGIYRKREDSLEHRNKGILAMENRMARA